MGIPQHTTAIGTTTGTVVTFFANVGTADIVQTVILSAIGAVVSFIVSLALKALVKKFKK